MPLSPEQQTIWDTIVERTGELSGPDITTGPLRLPVGCLVDDINTLLPQTPSDLAVLLDEQYAEGKIGENDREVGISFIETLYLLDRPAEMVVELPVEHDGGETYVIFQFPNRENREIN